MIAAYIRVSSRSQDTATQRESISRAAAARGHQIGLWSEEKRSGAKLDRPELTKIREAVKAGDVRKLYVFRLDRLTRSGIRDTLEILEELNIYGCEVVSVADGFDLAGPAANIVVAVMAWAAEMERLALGERIAAARARVERAGGRWGRPSRVEAHDVASIRARHKKGDTIRAIAQAVKVPRSTVAAVLSEKGAYARAVAKPLKKARGKV